MTREPLLPGLGIVDLTIIGVMTCLGVYVAFLAPKKLESALGLQDSMSMHEANIKAAEMRRPKVEPSRFDRLKRAREDVLQVVEPILAFLSLGAGLATFRRPSAWSKRALRRRGILTLAVVTLFFLTALSNEFILRHFDINTSGVGLNPISALWGELTAEIGLGVLVLWVILLLGRRWSGAADWHDRVGRTVGWLLILDGLCGSRLSQLLY